MTALATEEQMRQDVAKKKATPPRNDEAVRIRNDVIAKARVVASFENKSIADYISDTLRPIVDRDFARHIKKHSGKPDPA
jgi:hypothetical protein